MKQRLFKYVMSLILTLLCGLYLVHSNLNSVDNPASEAEASFFNIIQEGQNAQVGHSSLSGHRQLAVEVAEIEEQEEEIRHTPSSGNSKHFGSDAALFLKIRFLGLSLNPSKVSFANLKNLAIVPPFRRYLRYQVFRI
ncbi:hypothetical protein ACOCEA_02530 [Maribacter sp. CXY002]|uniref:hypothetical protein n=1 Tax=Maribacter luteocoastalis TaxID=3407671 RepID=UPI003B673615